MKRGCIFMFVTVFILSACTTTVEEQTAEVLQVEESIHKNASLETSFEKESQEELPDEDSLKEIPLTEEEHEQAYTYEYAELSEGIPSCEEKEELFTVAPLAAEDIRDITPLGNLAPTAHTLPTLHMYWNLRLEDPENQSSIAAEVDVYAPSDMYIKRMSRVQDMDGLGKPDYGMHFFPCKEFYAYFDHLASVSKEIEDAFNKAEEDLCEEYTLYYESGPRNWEYCRKDVDIFIEKGKLIGTAGGGRDQKALDVGSYDYRMEKHTLANPDRWEFYADGNLPYVVCPLDYFSQDIRESYEALIPRTENPVCGEVVQDLPGTAQGNWLPQGTPEHGFQESTFLALVHDNYDPSIPVFSIGTEVETVEYGEYIFSMQKSGLVNRGFSDVEIGELYCYEDLEANGMGNTFEGIIILQMPDENTLLIEGQDKSSCGNSWEFSGRESEFVR